MSAEIRKRRLGRLDLVFVRSPIYFVTACTQNRRNILATPTIHETFYVRENPVLAGLVASIQDWPYLGEIFALEYRSEK
jgi:hypothetical protein